MTLHDAVYKRISTRTFEQTLLKKDDIKNIKQVLASYQTVKGPFGDSFDFTFDINNIDDKNGKKIGTYGLLKNVPAYIGGICQNSIESIIDFGYVFEYIILELTALEFGTCWLGGTFKRKDYRKALTNNDIIPAISPVGFRAPTRSFIDKMLRSTAQSDNRLPFEVLFVGVNGKALSPYLNPQIKDCLDMVRKAPSASNKQPWRIVVDTINNVSHFYIARTKNYAKFLSYDIQALDIGIALAHFEIGLQYHKIPFTREKLETYPLMNGWEYVISIIHQ